MDELNIFIATTIKGPSKQEAAGHFLIELIHNGEIMTYPPEGKSTFIYHESTTITALTTELLANALHVSKYIIDRYTDKSLETISVWMEEQASGPYCNRWFDKWQQDGWMNSKGEPIKDAEKWQKLIEEMKILSKRYIFNAGHNSYKNLLQQQAQKELNKRKTLDMIHTEREAAGV